MRKWGRPTSPVIRKQDMGKSTSARGEEAKYQVAGENLGGARPLARQAEMGSGINGGEAEMAGKVSLDKRERAI